MDASRVSRATRGRCTTRSASPPPRPRRATCRPCACPYRPCRRRRGSCRVSGSRWSRRARAARPPRRGRRGKSSPAGGPDHGSGLGARGSGLGARGSGLRGSGAQGLRGSGATGRSRRGLASDGLRPTVTVNSLGSPLPSLALSAENMSSSVESCNHRARRLQAYVCSLQPYVSRRAGARRPRRRRRSRRAGRPPGAGRSCAPP